jgi:hypothetical protein
MKDKHSVYEMVKQAKSGLVIYPIYRPNPLKDAQYIVDNLPAVTAELDSIGLTYEITGSEWDTELKVI